MAAITLYEAPQRQHPTIKKFLADAQLFNWTTARQFRLWFWNREERDNGRVERLLKKLSDENRLRKVNFFGRCVYKAKRLREKDISPDHIWHGLGVTEGLIRLWKADPFPKAYHYEREYAGQKPEFGITYSTGKTLLYEFCTHDNMRTLKAKIRAYEQILDQSRVVLFVCDYDREGLVRWVLNLQPRGSFYFTDYLTFKSVRIGEQLTAKIYLTPSGELGALRNVQLE